MFFFLPLIDCCRRLTHLQELSLRYISEAFILIYWLIYWPALCKPSETTEADFGEFSSSEPFFSPPSQSLSVCATGWPTVLKHARARCDVQPTRKNRNCQVVIDPRRCSESSFSWLFSFFVISWICVSGAFFMNLNYLCFDYFCWCIVSHVMKDSNEQLSLKNTN